MPLPVLTVKYYFLLLWYLRKSCVPDGIVITRKLQLPEVITVPDGIVITWKQLRSLSHHKESH